LLDSTVGKQKEREMEKIDRALALITTISFLTKELDRELKDVIADTADFDVTYSFDLNPETIEEDG
jgi:hypothetical protein